MTTPITAQIAIAPIVTTIAPRIDGFASMFMRVREVIAGERAEHVDVAVREVDEPQHPVHHRVAERDQRIDGAEREAVDELLEEGIH